MLELTLANLHTKVLPFAEHSEARLRAVLVLLHGYGEPGDALISLAKRLKLPPGTALACPEGLISLNTGTGVRAWWAIDENGLRTAIFSGETRLVSEAVDGDREFARRSLVGWVNALLQRFDLRPEHVVWGGFSQGANAALDFVLYDERPWAGLVFMSGTRIEASDLAAQLHRRPPVPAFITHGRTDPIVPLCLTERLCQDLENAHWNVELSVFEGTHEIPDSVIVAVSGATERFLGSVGCNP